MDVNKLFRHWTYHIFFPGTVLREKYEAFKQLLDHDRRSHELLAELEEVYYQGKKVDIKWVERRYGELSRAVADLIENLRAMAPASYVNLPDYFKKIDSYIRFILAPAEILFSPPFTVPLAEISEKERLLAGGKAMNLARLQRELHLPVPSGFVITTNAFNYFIEFNNLRPLIDARLAGLDVTATKELDQAAKELMALVGAAEVPPDVKTAISASLKKVQSEVGGDVRLALRSSAVSEDSEVSFAGQYRTVLNVTAGHVLESYKQVLASKYSARALYYRIQYGLTDPETPMAVLALHMVDARASGVIATTDSEGVDPDMLSIHAIWGLGELLVGGEVSPDIIRVKKQEKPEIVEKRAGKKMMQMKATPVGTGEKVPVPGKKQSVQSLSEEEALLLAHWGMEIERHYQRPQDVEWSLDGAGRPFVLQARPTMTEKKKIAGDEPAARTLSLPVLMRGGDRAASGIGGGRVFRLTSEEGLEAVPDGAVLVAENTLPSYVKVIDRLRAVVTDRGSVAGHFASVAREFGVPTLVNAGNVAELLGADQEVTVDADRGIVYAGIAPGLPKKKELSRQFAGSSFRRKLKYMIDFISPLGLVDPAAPSFAPEGCRSLHDIIRFVHEKGMAEMFFIGPEKGAKMRGARRLVSDVPLITYVLNVGKGLRARAEELEEIRLDHIDSLPMQALWRGLTHPGVQWAQRHHFDWQAFDSIVMAGGIARQDSTAFASYAVIDRDYLNFNMRFGYHFTILDTLCGPRPDDNYITLRFAGGGGDFQGRALRIEFLAIILRRLGFTLDSKGDLLDARLSRCPREVGEETLDMIGRLLGATKLMDMVLRDAAMVETYADDFFRGRYNFSSAAADGRAGG